MIKVQKNWIVSLIISGIILIIILSIGLCGFTYITTNANKINTTVDEQWGGYCPVKVYQIFDKETGVYYAVTERGGICPMYTIEGEVKLVDQGNEYIVHKNLGEPNAQE